MTEPIGRVMRPITFLQDSNGVRGFMLAPWKQSPKVKH